MASLTNPAVPKGSTILVTGINGYLGSHVADQFLQHGYNVRGTVRDVNKSNWLCNLFEGKYGKGRFELLAVPDISAEGAYDEVVKGTSAFIHVAAVVGLNPDPNQVIPIAVSGSLNALKAAYSEPGVKRFVLTSSSSAALPSGSEAYKQPHVITQDSWSEDGVQPAWAPPPYTPERAMAVYSVSKAESEQAVWKYHKEHRHTRPDLVVNSVLPNVNFGKCLDVANQGYPSSAGLIFALWQGVQVPDFIAQPRKSPLEKLRLYTDSWPDYFVDVQDTGIIHVAAALLPDVQDERIFAFAEPYNWNKVLGILRKQNPDHSFPDDFEGSVYPHTIKPRDRAEQLLKSMGLPGWTSLENSLLKNTEQLRQVEA
ncbi:aldehyde reductase (NAD dependent epimerase/dehydratase) [Colletotrichum tofieldiae]|uniref:Aldehyde reductase (NAD dependent epimerase/dehydratase) n=1 Tax=Colletotrichum tofieldiae TaxID=708197 RepID=A0A166S186_9PEZI|nr:aldehyde reductase (NAD dependent epimerase/dehydratase) [Colletotrichum tofieldiae]